jgi:hypothetical protein
MARPSLAANPESPALHDVGVAPESAAQHRKQACRYGSMMLQEVEKIRPHQELELARLDGHDIH